MSATKTKRISVTIFVLLLNRGLGSTNPIKLHLEDGGNAAPYCDSGFDAVVGYGLPATPGKRWIYSAAARRFLEANELILPEDLLVYTDRHCVEAMEPFLQGAAKENGMVMPAQVAQHKSRKAVRALVEGIPYVGRPIAIMLWG